MACWLWAAPHSSNTSSLPVTAVQPPKKPPNPPQERSSARRAHLPFYGDTPMGTTDGQAVTRSGGSSCHMGGQGSPGRLGRSRGLVIAAAVTTVAVAGALALGQHSLAAANLLPLLYVLPCAAMMFMCMK